MAKKQETAELKQIAVQMIDIKVRGLSPVILHRWSDKARQEMLDKQMKKTPRKEAKDPERQFEDSVYRTDDGVPGFPADGFKGAMVRGAKILGLPMTDARGAMFVFGEYSSREDRELVRLNGELSMREDTVRLQTNVADIRFRGQVTDWEATLRISYNADMISAEQLVNMLHAAGFGVGIGDWRPEKNGMFGRFEVVGS